MPKLGHCFWEIEEKKGYFIENSEFLGNGSLTHLWDNKGHTLWGRSWLALNLLPNEGYGPCPSPCL